jgi:hypothetical protein
MIACKDLYLKTLNDMLDLVTLTKKVIDQFFPGIKISAPVIGIMDATATVQPPIFVLLKWIERYPGVILIPKDATNLRKLKNIYISLNLDWEEDPFIMEGMFLGLI